MKKFLSILLVVFMVNNLSAQQLSTTGVPYQFTKSMAPGIKIFPSHDEGFTGLLFPVYGLRKEMAKDGSNAALIRINEEVNSITKTSFNIPLDYSYITSFENDIEVISLYSTFDKKSNEFILYKCVLNKESQRLAFDPEKLASFELSLRDGRFYYVADSDDNTKHSLTLLITNRKKEFTGLYTMLMNEEGEVLWGSTQMPAFNGQTFDVEDVQVTNDGEVIMGVRSCTLNPRGTHSSNENIHVITVSEDGMDMVTQEVSFGAVKDMAMKIMSNGNLFFGGYYSSVYKDPATGVFSVVYDREKKQFNDLSNRYLTDLIKDDKKIRVFGNRQKNSKFDLACRAVHQLDNGNIALMGEQALLIIVVDSKGLYKYYYHRKDIFCHYFSPDGEEIRTHTIPKYQLSVGTTVPISYDSFPIENNIYVVYNDNSDNYTPKSKELKLYTHNKGKKSCTVLATITEDNEPEKKIIHKFDNTSSFLFATIYNNESEAILSYLNKKKQLTLHRLTF